MFSLEKNLNWSRRILKISFGFIFVAVKVYYKCSVFSPTRLTRCAHQSSYCTYMLPGECEPRCVYVCVCERANATQKSRCIIIDSTPYTHRTHTTCIHTLNKCSCICKWLYTTYFFFSFFFFFCCSVHPRCAKLLVNVHRVFLFMGFFFFIFASLLACWMFHLHFLLPLHVAQQCDASSVCTHNTHT